MRKLLLGGVAAVIALLQPAVAHADTPETYGAAHSSAICSAWKANPTHAGLLSVVAKIEGGSSGLGDEEAGEAVAYGIHAGCPDQMSALQKVADAAEGSSGSSSSGGSF